MRNYQSTCKIIKKNLVNGLFKMKKTLIYLTLIFLMSCGGPAVLRDVKVNNLSIKETV